MPDDSFSPPTLTGTDFRFFEAAEGWLELGDWNSAHEELSRIHPSAQAHPDVLKLRVEIFSVAKRWDSAIGVAMVLVTFLPDDAFGHIRLAYALHELKRTQEAWNALLPAADKFPDVSIIPYNLACYAAQLGDLVAARDWLDQAFRVGGAEEMRQMALEDPDLAPLWDES